MEPEAIDILLQSVKKYEYNWSAWMQLGSLASTTKQVRETYDIKKKTSFYYNIYHPFFFYFI